MPEVEALLLKIRTAAGSRMKSQADTLTEIAALVAAAQALLNP